MNRLSLQPLPPRRASAGVKAFTLIEFILVMALLMTVMAFAAPTLSNFFRGRKLSSEARRFVTLTRYGQSRAVSEGSPMILWLDQTEGSYGLRQEDSNTARDLPVESERLRELSGYEGVNKRQPAFRLADDLRFSLTEGSQTNGRIVTIRFLPDGAMDEGSLRTLLIQQQPRPNARDPKPESVWIVQSRDQSRYEIVDETSALERLATQPQAAGGLYPR